MLFFLFVSLIDYTKLRFFVAKSTLKVIVYRMIIPK